MGVGDAAQVRQGQLTPVLGALARDALGRPTVARRQGQEHGGDHFQLGPQLRSEFLFKVPDLVDEACARLRRLADHGLLFARLAAEQLGRLLLERGDGPSLELFLFLVRVALRLVRRSLPSECRRWRRRVAELLQVRADVVILAQTVRHGIVPLIFAPLVERDAAIHELLGACLGSRSQVAAHQAFQIVADKELFAFVPKQQFAIQLRLPALRPGPDCVGHEVDGELHGRGVGGCAGQAHLHQRQPIDQGNLAALEKARFQKLSSLRRDQAGVAVELDAAPEDANTMGAIGALVLLLEPAPSFFAGLRCRGAGMLEDPAGPGAVAEKGGAEALCRQAEPDGFAGHADHVVAHQAVEAHAGQVQHVFRRHRDVAAIGDDVIDQAAGLGSAGPDAVGRLLPEAQRLAGARAFDHRIAVAPVEGMGGARLAEVKGVGFLIGSDADQLVQIVVGLDAIAAAGLALIEVQRHAGDRLGDDPRGGPDADVIESADIRRR